MADTATAILNIAISSSKKGDGLKSASADLTDVSKKSEATRQAINKAALAVGALGVGITAYAKNATDYTVELVKNSKELSRETGTSIQNASQLVYVAGRMGVSADQASTAFGIFSKQIVAATKETGAASQAHADLQNKIDNTKLQIKLTTDEIKKNGDKTGELSLKVKTLQTDLAGQQSQLKDSANAFERLGIKVTDAQGHSRSFNDILVDTADKFKGMQNGSEKTAVAMELFGRSGKDMIPILNLGSQGIKDLEQKADKLGLTLTTSTIGAVSKYIASQKDLTDSTNSLKVAVGTATAPVLTAFNEKVNSVVQALLNSNGAIKTATVSVLAFGGPVLTGAAGVAGFAANIRSAGVESFVTAARFGLVGIAAAGAAATIGYLGFNVFDTARKTGDADQALSTWQGRLLSAVPVVGEFTATLLAMVGQHQAAKYAAEQLAAAHDRTAQSIQGAKLAGDQLKDAELAKEGSDLAVQQAQLNYNQAVAEFGPNSIQAKQASYNLKVAQEQQKEATDHAKDAVQNKSDSDQKVAKNKDLENHLKDQKRSADDSKKSIWDLVGSLKDFDQINIGKKLISIGIDIDKSLLHKLHVPGFAAGVTNFGGGLAIVGEKGPELVSLPSGSDVITSNESNKILNKSDISHDSSHKVTINQTNHIYNNVDMREANTELGWRLLNA